MTSNTVLIGSLIVISVFYVGLTLVLTSEQVQPTLDIKEGRVQGIFDQCNEQNDSDNTMQFDFNCTKGPPKNWSAIYCSINRSDTNDQVNIFMSTTLSAGGEFCGAKISRALVCAISSNLVQNNINAIKNSLTKEAFDNLIQIYGNNSNQTIFEINNTNEGLRSCFPFFIQIEEQEHGQFVVNKLNISNQFSNPQNIKSQRKELIFEIIYQIHKQLQENGIKAQIFWRIKSPGSIRLKMILRNITMDQLNDILGIRIIVNKVDECYKVIEIIHKHFEYMHDEFDDYIQSPKKSGYQSLQTIIYGHQNKPGVKFNTKIEVQVRTFKMNYEAEFGRAAHSIYKKNQTQLVQNLG